jgi:hypothetical protein
MPSSLTGQWSGGAKSRPWPATPTQLTATPTQPSATSLLTTGRWPPNAHRPRRRRKRRSRSKLLPPTRQTLLTIERTGSSRGPSYHSHSHSSCSHSRSSKWCLQRLLSTPLSPRNRRRLQKEMRRQVLNNDIYKCKGIDQ